MAFYTDQFYLIDPGNPPAAGTALAPQQLQIRDRNNDNYISAGGNRPDTINGSAVTAVWVGDQITVLNVNGAERVITGTTFYTQSGQAYFTPNDGSILHNATFVSSTYVTQSSRMPIGSLGPPCFVEGTMILTPEGERAIESLAPGDLVETLDNGAQPLRWVGQRRVPGEGKFAPVRFRRGAMGNARPLRVSPQHRMLVGDWRTEVLFGEPEVLVAAKHLVNEDTVIVEPMAEVTYMHLLFDRHEVIQAEGVATESLHPGDYLLGSDPALREELVALFPDLEESAEAGWETARHVLRAREAAILALTEDTALPMTRAA